jgi:hypothetical protein
MADASCVQQAALAFPIFFDIHQAAFARFASPSPMADLATFSTLII